MEAPQLPSRPSIAWLLAVLFLAEVSCTGSRRLDQLQICAHQDDDTYFMNPAVLRRIQAGGSSWTVYLTAGDAGRTDGHWQRRELGMRAAYAAMAGVADVWEPLPLTVGGRNLVAFQLAAAPRVKLVFLRLPDGGGTGDGYPGTGFASLQRLWTETASYAVSPVDGAPGYTREQLIAVLAELVASRNPRTLRIQDPTGDHGDDHSDHIHGALFAFEAHLRTAGVRAVRAYRAYNIADEPENLSDREKSDSRAIQDVYDDFDPSAPPNVWNDREIALGGLAPARGHLAFGTRCLAATASVGAPVALSACADTASQRFELRSDRAVVHSSGLCVATESVEPVPGSRLVLATCADVPGQRFAFFSDGHFRTREDLCLGDAGGGEPGVSTCSVAQRAWNLRASPVFPATEDFSAWEFGADVSRWGSLRLGDVTGDGKADACARRAGGVYCAPASGSGFFAPATRWHDDFSDALGWGVPEHGSTAMLGDVNGDGFDDFCARGFAGIWCVLSDGARFGAMSLWTSAYSNPAGGADPALYGSLRLGDVDGDSRADLCAREGGSIVCRRASVGGGFGAPEVWIGPEWGSLLALPASQVGRTLMLGDLDGDGAADVCERGTAGVVCAMANRIERRFEDPVMRSLGEFSDARGWSGLESYWRSIRLGDLTGDGKADLCGRGAQGLLCLFSIDGRFSAPVHTVSRDFGDAAGWDVVSRGATIQIGDVDGDGTADACGAGDTTLDCVVLDGR